MFADRVNTCLLSVTDEWTFIYTFYVRLVVGVWTLVEVHFQHCHSRSQFDIPFQQSLVLLPQQFHVGINALEKKKKKIEKSRELTTFFETPANNSLLFRRAAYFRYSGEVDFFFDFVEVFLVLGPFVERVRLIVDHFVLEQLILAFVVRAEFVFQP